MRPRPIFTATFCTAFFAASSAFAVDPEGPAPMPPNEDPVDVPAPVVVPAAACPARDRPCGFPRLALGFELGAAAFEEGHPFAFGEGVGSGTSPGPAWGFRVGWELFSWLAIDAHYLGFGNVINRAYSPDGPTRLITNAATLELRLTLPLRYVQPYILGGAGIYGTGVSGSSEALAATQFHGSTQPGFPMGVGIAVPITDHLSVGAEATYHFLLGESFSANDDIAGGDITTFNAMLRLRL